MIIKPTRGVRSSDAMKAHPKPIRRDEPRKPTRIENIVPDATPKREIKSIDMILSYLIVSKSHEVMVVWFVVLSKL